MPVGKLQRVQRWEGAAGATFRLSRREVSHRYGDQADRTLRVTGRNGSATLDRYETSTDYGATDEAAALGRFLAHSTGWTLLGN